jgi:hypothetical protein
VIGLLKNFEKMLVSFFKTIMKPSIFCSSATNVWWWRRINIIHHSVHSSIIVEMDAEEKKSLDTKSESEFCVDV